MNRSVVHHRIAGQVFRSIGLIAGDVIADVMN
jgi:hypothetical protein